MFSFIKSQEKLCLEVCKPILFDSIFINHIYIYFLGNSTAILGPSGAGKTTLLNVLSARLTTRWSRYSVHGSIKVDEHDVTPTFISQYCGFVEQSAVLLPTLTPRETISFAVHLRLAHLDYSKREIKIENLLKKVGLLGCADSQIGMIALYNVNSFFLSCIIYMYMPFIIS